MLLAGRRSMGEGRRQSSRRKVAAFASSLCLVLVFVAYRASTTNTSASTPPTKRKGDVLPVREVDVSPPVREVNGLPVREFAVEELMGGDTFKCVPVCDRSPCSNDWFSMSGYADVCSVDRKFSSFLTGDSDNKTYIEAF